MIVRTTYFNQLLQLRDQDLIKVVTGIRRYVIFVILTLSIF